MKPTLVSLALASVLLAACGGGNDSDTTTPATADAESGMVEGVGKGDPQKIADRDRTYIEERLAAGDTEDADLLRMVLELGSFMAYENALDTWDAASLKALHQRHGLDYVEGEPSADTAAAAAADGEIVPLNVRDCVRTYPQEDRNKTFTRLGHKVHIDKAGRPSWASHSWTQGQVPQSQPRQGYCQSVKVPSWGYSDDQGGHLIPSALGGWGGRANLVPQNGQLNQGLWTTIEYTARLCAGKEPRVTYTVYAYYHSNITVRPIELKAKLMVNHSSWNPANFTYGEFQVVNHAPTATELVGARTFNALMRAACR